MRMQHGYVTKENGSYLGHYSLWVTGENGEKRRHQKAFVIGTVDGMSKSQAKAVLRQRVVAALGAESACAFTGINTQGKKATLAWFIEQRWKPLRAGTWRGSTPATIDYIFSHIIKQFGDVPLDKLDAVQLQTWLNDMAGRYSGSLIRHLRH